MYYELHTGFIDEDASSSILQTLLDERPWMKTKNFTLISSPGELERFVDECIDKGIEVAIDLETTGLNNRPDDNIGSKDKIVGICLATDEINGFYVPVRHTTNAYLNVPPKIAFEQIKRLTTHCVGIFHNFKFDGEFLRYEGIVMEDPTMFEDTMLMAYVENSARKSKGLKTLSEEILGQKMIEIHDMFPRGSHVAFADLDPLDALYYAASDAVCTYGLFNHYKKRLDELDPKDSNGLKMVYRMEKKCTIVVMEMERNLVKIDVPYYQEAMTKVEQELEKIQDEIFNNVGRHVILTSPDHKQQIFDNVGSNVQLGYLLFGSKECGGLGIPYPKDEEVNKRGEFKVGSEVLEKVKDKSPIIPLILKFRELERVASTYLGNFLKNYDRNHEVKFKMNPTTADTGRFSATGGDGLLHDGYSGVNCQNIPSNYDPNALVDLRKGLIARPGYRFVAIDFSGEELRIATNLSKEKVWIREFLYGSGDLHSISARAIYSKPEVDKMERSVGKIMNFLVLYGGGASRLSAQAGIPLEVAKQGVENFFLELKGLKSWLEREMKDARARGYARTPFGRRCPLDFFYNNPDEKVKAKGDRKAPNAAIQGCGADIIKLALWRVWEYKKRGNFHDEFRIIMPIHDEIVYEIREDVLHKHIPKIAEIMKMDDILKDKLGWEVGLEVDAEYGRTFHVNRNYFKELAADEEAKKDVAGFITSYRSDKKFGKKWEIEDEYILELEEGLRPFQCTRSSPSAEKEEVELFHLHSFLNAPTNTLDKTEKTSILPSEAERSYSMSSSDVDYFDYVVKKTDKIAIKQTELIWEVLKVASKYTSGPSKHIRLLSQDGRTIHITDEPLPVDGFIAMAVNYEV